MTSDMIQEAIRHDKEVAEKHDRIIIAKCLVDIKYADDCDERDDAMLRLANRIAEMHMALHQTYITGKELMSGADKWDEVR